MTQRATDREAPFTDQLSDELVNRDGKLASHFQNALMATSYHSYLRTVRSREVTPNMIDFGKSYRYRRVAGVASRCCVSWTKVNQCERSTNSH
jgi:hypothetical protein